METKKQLASLLEDAIADSSRQDTPIYIDNIVYASDLGNCARYVWYKICNELPVQSVSSEQGIFLDDGLMHEKRTFELMKSALDKNTNNNNLELIHCDNTYKVEFEYSSNLRVRGIPDMLLMDTVKHRVIEVAEHKAITSDVFDRYKTIDTVPKRYLVQAAFYGLVHDCSALLILRNRDNGKYAIYSLSAEECRRLALDAMAEIEKVMIGNVPEPKLNEYCRFCAMFQKCFGKRYADEDKYTLDIEELDDVELKHTLEELIHRGIAYKKELDAIEANRKEVMDNLKIFLDMKNLAGISSQHGTVRRIRRTNKPEFTEESKAKIAELVDKGELKYNEPVITEYVELRERTKRKEK